MYARICEQRIQRSQPDLKTAEDHYHYGITLINARRPAEAVQVLERSAALGDSAHTRYALALACGLLGDSAAAAQHLQRAIDLDPATRSLARNDTDFQPLLQDSAIREVLFSERSVG
jgi:Flp pilus assembly protein TadD